MKDSMKHSMRQSQNQVKRYPDFESVDFLQSHIKSILSFYYPQCINPAGGYFQYYTSDGAVDKALGASHLVSLCRLTFNFAACAKLFDDKSYRDAAHHGLQYLVKSHLSSATGGYAWEVNQSDILDGSNKCYGVAFSLLAYAYAKMADIEEASVGIEGVYALLEKYFWEDQYQLYRDEISQNWDDISTYRGQNANMHCCEAMLAAYDATQDIKFLDRAAVIAKRIVVDLSVEPNGYIWEHYSPDWTLDFEFNKGSIGDKLRPWGFQPGHLAEWAKLLLLLNKRKPQAWMVKKAESLFQAAIGIGLDREQGGLVYSVSPENEVCNANKYSWAQGEAMVAAGLLAIETGNARYRESYIQQWNYIWDYLVDHKTKTWHRALDENNKPLDQAKEAMGKTDYHAVSACIEMINALQGNDQ